MLTQRTDHYIRQMISSLSARLAAPVLASSDKAFSPPVADLSAVQVRRYLHTVVRAEAAKPEDQRDPMLDGVEYFDVCGDPSHEASVPWLTEDEELSITLARGHSEGWQITVVGMPLRYHRDVVRPVLWSKFLGSRADAARAMGRLHELLENLTPALVRETLLQSDIPSWREDLPA